MPSVLLHPDVEQQLQHLPDDVESRIRSKLAEAGERPDRHCKPLKGRDEYSVRIGKRRAIVDWDRSAENCEFSWSTLATPCTIDRSRN